MRYVRILDESGVATSLLSTPVTDFFDFVFLLYCTQEPSLRDAKRENLKRKGREFCVVFKSVDHQDEVWTEDEWSRSCSEGVAISFRLFFQIGRQLLSQTKSVLLIASTTVTR